MKRSKPSPERAVPSQERARDTVALLLDATEQVAHRIGFDEATTKAIAAAAGVSPGTLYRYFPSKEALLQALVRRNWEAGLQAFGEAIALLKPGEFGDVVEEIAKLAFTMVAGRLEVLGKMRIDSNNLVHLSADIVDAAAMLVRGDLERRRAELAVDDLEVASILIVRSVVFLARVGVRDYAELVASGRYANEVASMVRRYLAKPATNDDA